MLLSCFLRREPKEQPPPIYAYKDCGSSVECLSQGQRGHLQGESPSSSATDLQTKEIIPIRKYLGRLRKLWVNRTWFYVWFWLPRHLLEEQYSIPHVIYHIPGLCRGHIWNTDGYKCQSSMGHCWTCYLQAKETCFVKFQSGTASAAMVTVLGSCWACWRSVLKQTF